MIPTSFVPNLTILNFGFLACLSKSHRSRVITQKPKIRNQHPKYPFLTLIFSKFFTWNSIRVNYLYTLHSDLAEELQKVGHDSGGAVAFSLECIARRLEPAFCFLSRL